MRRAGLFCGVALLLAAAALLTPCAALAAPEDAGAAGQGADGDVAIEEGVSAWMTQLDPAAWEEILGLLPGFFIQRTDKFLRFLFRQQGTGLLQPILILLFQNESTMTFLRQILILGASIIFDLFYNCMKQSIFKEYTHHL